MELGPLGGRSLKGRGKQREYSLKYTRDRQSSASDSSLHELAVGRPSVRKGASRLSGYLQHYSPFANYEEEQQEVGNSAPSFYEGMGVNGYGYGGSFDGPSAADALLQQYQATGTLTSVCSPTAARNPKQGVSTSFSRSMMRSGPGGLSQHIRVQTAMNTIAASYAPPPTSPTSSPMSPGRGDAPYSSAPGSAASGGNAGSKSMPYLVMIAPPSRGGQPATSLSCPMPLRQALLSGPPQRPGGGGVGPGGFSAGPRGAGATLLPPINTGHGSRFAQAPPQNNGGLGLIATTVPMYRPSTRQSAPASSANSTPSRMSNAGGQAEFTVENSHHSASSMASGPSSGPYSAPPQLQPHPPHAPRGPLDSSPLHHLNGKRRLSIDDTPTHVPPPSQPHPPSQPPPKPLSAKLKHPLMPLPPSRPQSAKEELEDIPSCPDSPSTNPSRRNAADCAVSLALLKHFYNTYVAPRPDAEKMTTKEVIDSILIPQSRTYGCRYVDIPALVTQHHVGKPHYFISHAWHNPFAYLVNNLTQYLSGAVDTEVRVWVDIFAVDQHNKEHMIEDLQNLKDAIKAASATLVMLDRKGEPMRRVWCLYEFDNTIRLKGPDKLVLLSPGFSLLDMAQVFSAIDVDSAQCFDERDKKAILADIVLHHGSKKAFNAKLKLLFLLDPLDYTMDIATLNQHNGNGKQFNFNPVWRHIEGASVNMAQAADKVISEQKTMRVLSNVMAARASSVSALGPPPAAQRVGSVYRMSDLSRPQMAVITGTAGQGKSSISAAMVSLQPAKIHAWHFCKYNDQRRQDPVRVIKTLAYQLALAFPALQDYFTDLSVDEVQQLVEPTRAFELLIIRPLYSLDPPQPVTFLLDALDEGFGEPRNVFNNPVLQMLLQNFSALPSSLARLVVTTRPEEGTLGYLRAKYGHAMREFTPLQLRHMEQVQAALLQNVMRVVKDQEAALDFTQALLERSGDTMVYIVLVMHLMNRHLQLTKEPLTIDMLPMDLNTAYLAVFKQHFGTMSLQDKVPVQQLLQVLMAAREPLSMSMLNALDLLRACRFLPGWKTLFFERDYQVYTLHKSMHDWLQDREVSGEFYASPTVGHERLGAFLFRQTINKRDISRTPSTYALKHTLAHLIRAGSSNSYQGSKVDEAVLDLDFLQHVFIAGHSRSLFGDLGKMERKTKAVVEVMRWLQLVGHALRAQPDATVQLAYDEAPETSLVSQAAASHYRRPAVMLINKPATWPLLLLTLTGHGDPVEDVCFNPRGHMMASASAQHGTSRPCIILSDTATGQQLTMLTAPGAGKGFQCVTFDSLGDILAAASNADVFLWDSGTGLPLMTLTWPSDDPALASKGRNGEHVNLSISSIAFNPAGTVLATASFDTTIKLWRRMGEEGDYVWAPWQGQGRVLRGHTSSVNCVNFSPDGNRLASAGDSSVRIWDVRSQGFMEKTLVGHEAMVNWVSYSPKGDLLASASEDKTIILWNATSGAEERVLEGHSASVRCVVFSPVGDKLASGSQDKTVRLWHVSTGAPLGVFSGHTSVVKAVRFHPDGAQIVSASSDKTVRMWDLGGLKAQRKALSLAGQSSRQSGDGPPVASEHADVITSVAIAAKGDRVATGSEDRTVLVYHVLSNGAVQEMLVGHMGAVTCVSFSPGGDWLASGSKDKSIMLWPINTSQTPGATTLTKATVTLAGHLDVVTSVVFHPDNNMLASTSFDGSVRLWSFTTEIVKAGSPPHCSAALLRSLKGHTDVINHACFSSLGDRLATASSDRTVRIWDPSTGQQLNLLSGHSEGVAALFFFGDRLASSDYGGVTNLWAATSGQQLLSQPGMSLLLGGTQLACIQRPEPHRVDVLLMDQQAAVQRELRVHYAALKIDLAMLGGGTLVLTSGRSVLMYKVQQQHG